MLLFDPSDVGKTHWAIGRHVGHNRAGPALLTRLSSHGPGAVAAEGQDQLCAERPHSL